MASRYARSAPAQSFLLPSLIPSLTRDSALTAGAPGGGTMGSGPSARASSGVRSSTRASSSVIRPPAARVSRALILSCGPGAPASGRVCSCMIRAMNLARLGEENVERYGAYVSLAFEDREYTNVEQQ